MSTGAGDPLKELDALASLPKKHNGNLGCLEKAILMNPDEKDLIVRAVAHPVADAELVSEFLGKRGVELPAASIRRHRRGICKCQIH